MKKIKILFLVLTVILFNSCSSDGTTSTTSTTTDSSDTTANAGAAISALFGGTGSASISDEVVLQKIKSLFIQIAYAETEQPDNCDEEPGTSDDVIVTQSGTAGSFGPDSDPVVITDADWCANGGTWSTYEISSANPVTFDCDDSTVVFIGGNGVWDNTADGTTEVAGTFSVADSVDGTGTEVACHGTFQGTQEGASDFTMNCADSTGTAITLLEDASCTQS